MQKYSPSDWLEATACWYAVTLSSEAQPQWSALSGTHLSLTRAYAHLLLLSIKVRSSMRFTMITDPAQIELHFSILAIHNE